MSAPAFQDLFLDYRDVLRGLKGTKASGAGMQIDHETTGNISDVKSVERLGAEPVERVMDAEVEHRNSDTPTKGILTLTEVMLDSPSAQACVLKEGPTRLGSS